MINQPTFDAILARYEGQPANLIPVLQEIQDEFNYLPKDELKVVADRLQVPLTQVYSVATFFKMFSLEPKGRHQVRVCLGTACHLRGGQRLVETVSRRLGVEVGHATEDLQLLPGDGGLPGLLRPGAADDGRRQVFRTHGGGQGPQDPETL